MDFSTGIPNHIEDVLVRMHTGQWFGWSDASDKVYDNLVIHDDRGESLGILVVQFFRGPVESFAAFTSQEKLNCP